MSENSQYLKKPLAVAARRKDQVDFSSQMFGKIPPQARDLEEAVLGALILERDAITAIIETLESPERFYVYSHQLIYAAILELYRESKNIDILTVTEQLKKMGSLEEAGGAHYLMELTNGVTSAASVEYHAHIVKQKSIGRNLIAYSSEIIKDAYDDTTDTFELLEKAEKNLFEIANLGAEKNEIDLKTGVAASLHDYDRRTKLPDDRITGVDTGFQQLNNLTGGWQNSDLVIIAARPGMGKTAEAMAHASAAAKDFLRHKEKDKPPKSVAVFSLEMSAPQLVGRLICSASEVDSVKFRRAKLNADEMSRVIVTMDEFGELPIIIDDTPGLSIFQLRTKARRLKQNNDVGLIIVDYLQLMSGGDNNNKNGNREQEISTISRGLKGIAKELDIPVIALAQLSRAVETRGGLKKPQLSDLRESGSIEQDADIVMFIYRPEYYGLDTDDENNDTRGVGFFIVAKHRNGALDEVKVSWKAEYTKFVDLPWQGDDSLHIEGVGLSANSQGLMNARPTDNSRPTAAEQAQADDCPF